MGHGNVYGTPIQHLQASNRGLALAMPSGPDPSQGTHREAALDMCPDIGKYKIIHNENIMKAQALHPQLVLGIVQHQGFASWGLEGVWTQCPAHA